MPNRIPDNFCDHWNLIPAWYINANIYIFWCQDCDTFILKDFTRLKANND